MCKRSAFAGAIEKRFGAPGLVTRTMGWAWNGPNRRDTGQGPTTFDQPRSIPAKSGKHQSAESMGGGPRAGAGLRSGKLRASRRGKGIATTHRKPATGSGQVASAHRCLAVVKDPKQLSRAFPYRAV